MIGNLQNAKDLLLCLKTGMKPELLGFEYIAMGAYRRAYRGPDGFIYKVDRNESAGKDMNGYNYSEWLGICNAQHMIPKPLQNGTIARVAHSQLFEIGTEYVLCQEFVPNSSSYNAIVGREFREVGDWFGVDDLHGDNYRVDDNGDVVIVDFGFNSSQNQVYVTCSECGNGHYKVVNDREEADETLVAWLGAAQKVADMEDVPF